MTDNTYSGWTNHATWLANMWIEESGGIYGAGCELGIEELLWELMGSPETGLAADVYNSWAGDVNYFEILEHHTGDSE